MWTPSVWGAHSILKSEFKYYGSGYYLQNLYKYLQTAWNAKKDANGHWRVTLPVYGYSANPLAMNKPLNKAFGFLAWLMGPSQAYACFTYPPPYFYVNAFVNVEIANVVYISQSLPPVHCNTAPIGAAVLTLIRRG